MLYTTGGITPNHKGHRDLEKRFVQYLDTKGFDNYDGTYHNKCNHGLADAIKNRHGGTTLAVRGRADRIAVHRSVESLVFEWDAKTKEYQDNSSLYIEALPLAHHILDAKLGKATLYVLNIGGQDKSFWTSNIPKIDVINIPGRWNDQQARQFTEWFAYAFPGVPVQRTPANRGSGDPYVVIPSHEVRRLQDWHNVIDNLIRLYGGKHE